jgi:hypothetical protein
LNGFNGRAGQEQPIEEHTNSAGTCTAVLHRGSKAYTTNTTAKSVGRLTMHPNIMVQSSVALMLAYENEKALSTRVWVFQGEP